MEIAIMASLLAKRDMDVNACHGAKVMQFIFKADGTAGELTILKK
jgi:hypothetical protein